MLKAIIAAVDALAFQDSVAACHQIKRAPIHGVVAAVQYMGAARLARIPIIGAAQTTSTALILSTCTSIEPKKPDAALCGKRRAKHGFVSGVYGKVSLAFMVAPPTIQYGSLGMADSLILMVMALVVFGPRRLPQIGRQIGKLMYEFRKASNDFKFQMEEELRNSEEADRRKKEEERQRAMAAQLTVEQASVTADAPPSVNAVESPYPGEVTYPPQYPPENQATTATVEEHIPQIRPPSTGEPVASSWPARQAELTFQPSETSAAGSAEASVESTPKVEAAEPAPKPESDPAAEALNQHG
jgi:sec-independent protein translocase protein TatB